MTHTTAIQWATDSANTYRYEKGGWHCVKVSEGCRHCYAERMNLRFGNGAGNGRPYRVDSRDHLGRVTLNEAILDGWRKAKQPRRIFVNSMTDTFLESIPEEMIFRVLDAMVEARTQLFYVLTKRAERMAGIIEDWLDLSGWKAVPSNILLGVSIEGPKVVTERLHWLARVPGLRFLSVEPLLGLVSLQKYLPIIDWVIVGGESGSDARPMHTDWAAQVWKECRETATPLFFQQWGAWWPLRELAKHHGLVDNARAYAGFGFINPDGKFMNRQEAFDGRYAKPSLTPLTAEGDYDGYTLIVKPRREQKPVQATLNGQTSEEYSPDHKVRDGKRLEIQPHLMQQGFSW